MTAPLPLPTLLSQALVAFTIELDTQFELKQPTGTWLTSYVMWANFLQYVEGGGTTYGELQARACVTKEQLHVMSGGMARWGYVTVSPGTTKAKADQRVVMTLPGRTAQDLWRPLAETIEVRWRDRFGAEPVAALRAALHEFVDQVDRPLPQFLPIARYQTALVVEVPDDSSAPPTAASDTLATLLSRALLALTLDYERDLDLSLALGANVVRVLGRGGVSIRELPYRTGASKEAVSFSVKYLEKHDYVVVAPDPEAPKVKQACLSDKGRDALDAYRQQTAAVEERAGEQFGEHTIANLRAALEPIVGDGDYGTSPLATGLVPPAKTWRASTKPPATLPHHPLVLHRGGYPDGS